MCLGAINIGAKPSKVVVTINNLLADLFIRQTFFAKCLKRVNLSNIFPTKLSRYMVISALQLLQIPCIIHLSLNSRLLILGNIIRQISV